MLARRLVPTFVLAVLALLVACAEAGDPPVLGPDPGVPISLVIVSGDAQEGPAGAELPDPLVVRVTAPAGSGDGGGGNSGNGAERPVAGQIVNFVVVQGGGSVFAGAAITNRDGLAQDWWTLGDPGDQRLEVRAVDPATGEKLVFGAFTAVATGGGGGGGAASDDDGDGFSEDDGDCDDGDASVYPGAEDPPGDGLDSDCDGFDFASGDVVYVATPADGGDDSDPGCGLDTATPCATVQKGIDRAAAEGRGAVLVSLGVYPGSVALADGVSLHGGYSAADGWAYDPADRAEIVGDPDDGSGPVLALLADGITTPTVVADLVIRGPDATTRIATGQGRSAYGVVARGSDENLVLRRNLIEAGNGMSGAPGTPGTSAPGLTAAMSGGDGGNAGTGTVFVCDESTRGIGGSAGTNPAGAGLNGGGGGDGGTMDTDCPLDLDATAGESGQDAQTVPHGFGGAGGAVCLSGNPGADGTDGAAGQPGSGGPAGGVLVGDFWHGRSGTGGGPGETGTGGGGGGGSGGCDVGSPDTFGAGGGGGGAGGLGAPTGGEGGAGGGGSFAIYLVASSPTIEGNTIRPGNGGNGGGGGSRGTGQAGGSGGAGGVFDGATGPGGAGGDGGRGGSSGGGGGGAGGASVGIYLTQGSVLFVSGNDIQTAGAVAGTGGGSQEPGEEGADGVVQQTASHGS